MTRWYGLNPVDASAFSTAPCLYRFPVRFAAPPERVWESLTSEASVAAWSPVVRAVSWRSPRPFGIGTARDVTLLLGSITVREEFFRWDEGAGYSFFARQANRPGLAGFAEDYVLAPDGDGTLFTWTVAIVPKPALTRAVQLAGPLNKAVFGRIAADAKRYFAA